MAKKKRQSDPFAALTWDDLEEWAGDRIVERGRGYQRDGRVSELARTPDGGLIAWVSGTEEYATKVVVDKHGEPESICTCPYAVNCKHGVAVVLEYLEQLDKKRSIPQVDEDDDRLAYLEGEEPSGASGHKKASLPKAAREELGCFLQDKSKDQLVNLLLDLAQNHSGVTEDLMDRRPLTSDRVKPLISSLRKEIRQIAEHAGWRDYEYGEGPTTDYSSIRRKLEKLLEAGHADEALGLGRELLDAGRNAVEQSEEGEDVEDLADCMAVVVQALDRSSLAPAARLIWAVETAMDDDYGIASTVADYLYERHPKEAWSTLADHLLAQLGAEKPSRESDEFSREYARGGLSNWAIHALEQAGRDDEILPLCESEARKTHNYERLIDRLMKSRRYEDADRWIREGIRATEREAPGIADSLRHRLKAIRAAQKNRPVVAALEVEEFVQSPSDEGFVDCRKTCTKLDVWPRVRGHLLKYLETGALPWKQRDWPLPPTELDAPKVKEWLSFPLFDVLIDIAIQEKDPESVLRWYDRRQKKHEPRWSGFDEDRIASAVQTYAPDRAVAIWQHIAGNLIAQTTPNAYDEAVRHLRKAGAVMTHEGKQAEWARYLQDLRQTHARKRRLMEALDRLPDKPILAQKSRRPRA